MASMMSGLVLLSSVMLFTPVMVWVVPPVDGLTRCATYQIAHVNPCAAQAVTRVTSPRRVLRCDLIVLFHEVGYASPP